jgi:hypothetical protein
MRALASCAAVCRVRENNTERKKKEKRRASHGAGERRQGTQRVSNGKIVRERGGTQLKKGITVYNAHETKRERKNERTKERKEV